MSSPSSKKRTASPAEDSMAPKRLRSETPLETVDNSLDDDEESENESVAMQSKAVEEFYPNHYQASNGRASPRRPSEMTEKQRLAVAVARFRPLVGPLPAGFDIGSLPTYRGPVSHDYSGALVQLSTTTTTDEVETADEPESSGVNDPIAVDSAPDDQVCKWSGCSRSFSGINGPTLLWLHLTVEHVKRPVVDPECKWVGCNYSNSVHKNLYSHVGGHVPEYRPFVCDDCGMGFKQNSHLTRHKKDACPHKN